MPLKELHRHEVYIMVKRHSSEAEAEVESECDTDSLPDRLINPNEYEQLSPTI